jgi:predicted HTH transcriptional regulator
MYQAGYYGWQMTLTELQEYIRQLRQANTDLTHVEAKAASELPKRLWETLSAFSNTANGGVLILGVADEIAEMISFPCFATRELSPGQRSAKR